MLRAKSQLKYDQHTAIQHDERFCFYFMESEMLPV